MDDDDVVVGTVLPRPDDESSSGGRIDRHPIDAAADMLAANPG